MRVPARSVPLFLARVHASLEPAGETSLDWRAETAPADVRALCHGAGLTVVGMRRRAERRHVRVRRERTLPDWVGRGLRVLICGLNPSLYSADHGIPFGRPGNRFWPAALEAGLVPDDREPFAAFERGIGFTDCVKRATRKSSELRPAEYDAGVQRVEALIRRYRPRTTCFVGLEGWRRAIDRSASSGWVEGGFGGRPAYLMPSTSGLNAHASLAELTAHLVRAAGPAR